MSNKDIDQARKLSNNEMEGQKGGASKATRTFTDLERFFVKPNGGATALLRPGIAADSVMCAGQTRSGDLALNPAQLGQLAGRAGALRF